MTRKHYTTVDASTVLTLTLDEIFVMAQAARFDGDTRNEDKLMAAFHLVTVRNHYATATATGNHLMMISAAGYIAEYTKVFNHLWSTEIDPTPTTPTPTTPTPTPSYTAVGLPVMVQDGPCDVSPIKCDTVTSLVATSHRGMVDVWAGDCQIATRKHDYYHVTTTNTATGESEHWFLQRAWGKYTNYCWGVTRFDDVNPVTRATIWAGDMADKLTAAGVDLATLTTPADVHCAIAQWLVDVDGNDPYDVDGIFVSMMMGNHSPVDVAEKTIEDWYQRWVKLNAEAIDNGTYQPATKSTPTTTPATIDTTNDDDDDDDDDGYVINDVDFDDAYMTRANAARREYTNGKDCGFRFELWVAVEKMISDGETNRDIRRRLLDVIDGCIEAVSDATR